MTEKQEFEAPKVVTFDLSSVAAAGCGCGCGCAGGGGGGGGAGGVRAETAEEAR
jgi:hypothetical protein